MKNLYLITFLLCSITYLNSQDVHDLDHDSKGSFVKSLYAYEGGFIYSTSNNDGMLTRVIHVEPDGNRKVLFEAIMWHEKVKYFEDSNGALDIYLYHVIDYDIPGPFTIHLNYDGTNVSDTYEIANTANFERLDDGTFRVDDWDSSILKLSASGETLGILEGMRPVEIIQDIHGDVFYFTGPWVMKENGSQFDLVKVLPQDILNVRYFEEEDRFMLNSNLSFYVYENDFTNEILGVDYPQDCTVRSGMNYFDGKYYMALRKDNKGSLWSYDQTNGFVEVHNTLSLKTDLEFVEIENDEFILGFGYEEESHMAMVSKFALNAEPEYDFVDISLDDVEIELDSANFAFETEFSDYFNYYFGTTFTLTNHGDEQVNSFDLYSHDFTGLPFNLMQRNFSLSIENAELDPGETKQFNGVVNIVNFSPPQSAHMFIQGANFKIDSDMTNNVIFVDMINSTKELNKISQTSVYPNPVNNLIYVIDDSSQTNYSYTILDVLGRTHKSGEFLSKNGIDVSSLANGLYYLHRVDNRGNAFISQFIKN